MRSTLFRTQQNTRYDGLFIAAALINLENDYNKMLSDKVVCAEEMIAINELINSLRAFEHIQRGWARGFGKLSNYWKEKQISNPLTESNDKYQKISQQELIDESIHSTKGGAEFAKIFASQLLRDINEVDGRYYKVAQNNKILFQQIKHCSEELVESSENINSKIKVINTIVSRPACFLARRLNARFIPLFQGLDPLRGKTKATSDFSGACFGHAMSWIHAIEQHDQYLSQPTHDKETFLNQKYQKEDDNIHRLDKFGIYYDNVQDIWVMLEKHFSTADNNAVFRLCFRQQNSDGHAMGYRKSANEEIEFFDCNLGLFVFKNLETFKIWIFEILSSYLRTEAKFKIAFHQCGVQNPGSTATIPLVERLSEDNDHNQIMDMLPKDPINFCTHHSYIKKLSILSTYSPDLRNTIQAAQTNSVKLVESDIYSRLDQFKLHSTSANFYPNDHQYYELKRKVIDAIDIEISRLKNNVIGDSITKINALITLKANIAMADPTQDLTSCVEKWLCTKPHGDKTHREIIQVGRKTNDKNTKTYQFILNLVTNNEINLSFMKVMRAELLNHIFNIINFYKTSPDTMPTTFKDIVQLLSRNKNDINDVIANIKARCSQNSTGMFTRVIKWRSREVDSFYKTLSKLDLDNPKSIRSVSNKLIDLLEKMEKQHKIYVAPENNPSFSVDGR